MKKIFRIFFIYIVIALVACFVYSFVKDVPEFLLSGTITRYKIYRAFYSFCKFFPAIVITGFALSHAVVFGRNPEGSTERFSSHMFERYRQVLITSLLCALLLTLSKEIFVPFLSRKITRLERLPLLVQEYVKAGRQMNIIGKHELAYQYGIHAAKLDPHSSEAQLLIRDTELFAKESNAATKIENVTSALSEEGYTVSELRLLAENAFEKAQYFNAHYYAQTAINIASGRDTNYERLRSIAAQSWNMLSVSHEDALSEEVLVFRKKLEGYTSFMQGDNLKAYYIFTELSDSKKLRDPDIERYLKLANERVQNEYFFIDEMLAKQEFETGANIYFSIKKENEGTDIVYIKGITPVTGSSGTVQYLRDFSVYSLDRHDSYKGSLHVPYAKMLQIPVSNFDEKTRVLLGITDKEFVPYILLTSIDRKTEGLVNSPSYFGSFDDSSNKKNQIVLPISYDNFLTLSRGVQNTKRLSLLELRNFVGLAQNFGFGKEVYASEFASRLLYPLFVLLVLLYVATFAWNYRLGEHLIFKMTWAFAFPLFSIVAYILYRVLYWFFELTNLAFVSAFQSSGALAFLAIFYVLVLIVVSFFFVYRKI